MTPELTTENKNKKHCHYTITVPKTKTVRGSFYRHNELQHGFFGLLFIYFSRIEDFEHTELSWGASEVFHQS